MGRGAASALRYERPAEPPLALVNTCHGAAEQAVPLTKGVDRAANSVCDLSGRALNVLKLLASEMTGEVPARENWIPSDAFLHKVTFESLATARNCGPLTTREIIQWARSRGMTIAPPCWVGKSFPQMWRHFEARFAAGELTRTEIAEVLERSIRRQNTRVPVAVQRILLKLLSKAGEDAASTKPEPKPASRFGPQMSPAAP